MRAVSPRGAKDFPKQPHRIDEEKLRMKLTNPLAFRIRRIGQVEEIGIARYQVIDSSRQREVEVWFILGVSRIVEGPRNVLHMDGHRGNCGQELINVVIGQRNEFSPERRASENVVDLHQDLLADEQPDCAGLRETQASGRGA